MSSASKEIPVIAMPEIPQDLPGYNRNPVSEDFIRRYRSRHNALMQIWKDRYPDRSYFTEDGIVNPEIWFRLPENRRILFLLKEAYTKEKSPSDWNEAKWLNGDPCRENCPYKNCSDQCHIRGNTFNRISEWTYCILECPDIKKSFPDNVLMEDIYWLGVYSKTNTRRENNTAYNEKRTALLKNIAIVNLKKTDGQMRSDNSDLENHMRKTEDLLLQQIEIIQPHYVICCGTWKFLGEDAKNFLNNYKVLKAPHPNAHISRLKMLECIIE